MVLAVHFGLRDTEDVVQQQGAEVRDVVPFPVLNTTLQVLDGRIVLSPSLRLVDLIGDALGRGDTGGELVDIRVVCLADSLQERLSQAACEHATRLSETASLDLPPTAADICKSAVLA